MTEVVNYYPSARIQLQTIRFNKSRLDSTYRFARIEWKAQRDTLKENLKFMGRDLAVALSNQPSWYHDIRLWFILGAISGIFTVSQTLKVVF